MIAHVDAETLQTWLYDGDEIALLDVREAGLFGEGHALLAVNLPLSRLELDVAALVPRLDTRTVLIAEDDLQAHRAAKALRAIGYQHLHTLSGGAAAWNAAGLLELQGVNVPSKALAEFVEHAYHTPDITPEALAALQAEGADLVLLDGRTVEEHRRFHVPGAIACPNSELVPRFADLVPSPATLVVVTCAGRTRGVMGAQTLINAGVPNRVLALRGGTQGWRLAGLDLERQPAQEAAPPSASAQRQARVRADAVAARFAVPRIDAGALSQWQADTARTTYLFDVRTQDAYRAGHLPGAVWAIGVQLVQCLDQWAAVRGARLVLVDDDGVRATITAHWLRQLGWDAVAFTPDAGMPLERAEAVPPRASFGVPRVSPQDAHAQSRLLLDASPSAQHRAGHAAGARWVNRARLAAVREAVQAAGRVAVLAHEDGVAELVARDLADIADVAVVQGGLAAWRDAGLPIETSAHEPPDAERIDHLFWLHDRHDGNAASSAAYLQWEERLPATIGDPARAGFRLAHAV